MTDKQVIELSLYTGIFRLKELLDQAKIPYEFEFLMEENYFPTARYHLIVPINHEKFISIIQGPCTAGNPLRTNLLEVMSFKVPAIPMLEPTVMSSQQAFNYIRKHTNHFTKKKRGVKKHGNHRQKRTRNLAHRHSI